jgi:hypothetical protein
MAAAHDRWPVADGKQTVTRSAKGLNHGAWQPHTTAGPWPIVSKLGEEEEPSLEDDDDNRPVWPTWVRGVGEWVASESGPPVGLEIRGTVNRFHSVLSKLCQTRFCSVQRRKTERVSYGLKCRAGMGESGPPAAMALFIDTAGAVCMLYVGVGNTASILEGIQQASTTKMELWTINNM